MRFYGLDPVGYGRHSVNSEYVSDSLHYSVPVKQLVSVETREPESERNGLDGTKPDVPRFAVDMDSDDQDIGGLAEVERAIAAITGSGGFGARDGIIDEELSHASERIAAGTSGNPEVLNQDHVSYGESLSLYEKYADDGIDDIDSRDVEEADSIAQNSLEDIIDVMYGTDSVQGLESIVDEFDAADTDSELDLDGSVFDAQHREEEAGGGLDELPDSADLDDSDVDDAEEWEEPDSYVDDTDLFQM